MMTDSHPYNKPKLLPEDFWARRTVSPLAVLADSHHLYLMYMQFVTFFSRELLKPYLPPDQIQEAAKTLADYVESVNSVMNAVEYYMNIKVRPSFYKKDNKISSVEIFLYFRQRLLDARDQNDVDTLRTLAIVFDMLWDLAGKKKIQGGIFRVLENLENSAYDSVQGVGWKSIIPSEEEIRLAFQDKETD